MFNNSKSPSNSRALTTKQPSNNYVTASGFDFKNGLNGLGDLQDTFMTNLELSSEDATPEAVYEGAQLEGKFRSFNFLLREASKQRLNAARGALNTVSTIINHNNQALALETQYNQTISRGLESYSEGMVKLGVVQNSHTGYAEYNNVADELIDW